MFQLVARFVTNHLVYIALCSRNHSLMVVTFSTRTETFKSKIGNYRKSFLTSFTNEHYQSFCLFSDSGGNKKSCHILMSDVMLNKRSQLQSLYEFLETFGLMENLS